MKFLVGNVCPATWLSGGFTRKEPLGQRPKPQIAITCWLTLPTLETRVFLFLKITNPS